VLAGGVVSYAINEFLTISLLPTTVADIGGERLYAWVTTLYLVGSVIAAATVNSVLVRIGARSSYLVGLTVFGAGSLVCALAPRMEILLGGRALQGLGGGLVAGLGYALINAVLPSSLWTRASALVSAMWGIGTLVGPAMGGLFAQLGEWRWAFGAVALLSAVLAGSVAVVLTPGADVHHAEPMPMPVRSVLTLGASALVVSVAQLPRSFVAAVGLFAVGGALLGTFLYVDRRSVAAVLPRSVFHSGPERWIFLTLGLLMATTKVDLYVPLLGQRLANLLPLSAGFLGAALPVGWAVSEFASASLTRVQVVTRLVTVAPLVVASGLVVAACTRLADHNPVVIGALWASAMAAVGAGVGVAWPHLSAWAMGCVDHPEEGGAAAAAINTVQVVAGIFGAGLAGVVVNMADGPTVSAAGWLFAVFAVLCTAGGLVSYRAGRGARSPGDVRRLCGCRTAPESA
jgi:MFS family permease